MAIVCPTVTATDTHTYRQEMELAAKLSSRIHLDISDDEMTGVNSVNLEQAWWDKDKTIDIHLMVKNPTDYIQLLIARNPNLVVIHAEAEVNHEHFTAQMIENDIKVGVAILQDTNVDSVRDIIKLYSHALVFSGHFGHHGGKADLTLTDKVDELKTVKPDLEISWDGGINISNIKILADSGIDILNVGGAIQNAEYPDEVFKKLQLAVS